MSRRQSSDPLKNTFPFPNEIFILGLCPGELAVYSYLLCCANRKTGQCWPSYKVIGKAVGMTENTVAKYVSSLERKGLIHIEPTTVTTKAGIKRNGNLLYTVSPFQDVLDAHYQVSTTNDIYSHVIASAEAKAAEVLDKFSDDIHPKFTPNEKKEGVS